jgi:hypothetical protein
MSNSMLLNALLDPDPTCTAIQEHSLTRLVGGQGALALALIMHLFSVLRSGKREGKSRRTEPKRNTSDGEYLHLGGGFIFRLSDL